MSLLTLVASAAAMAVQPVHTVDLEHRGTTYRVDYRAQVETRMRTVGMSAGPRTSTQRCVVTAKVMVERVIAGPQGQHELKSVLPGTETLTDHMPGDCRGREDHGQKLVAGKAQTVATHLAQAASADRQAALAAIDTAHHFAAN